MAQRAHLKAQKEMAHKWLKWLMPIEPRQKPVKPVYEGTKRDRARGMSLIWAERQPAFYFGSMGTKIFRKC